MKSIVWNANGNYGLVETCSFRYIHEAFAATNSTTLRGQAEIARN